MRVSAPGTRWTAGDRDELALRIRLRAVRMVAPQGFGYLGQALSAAEQVATVFTTARRGVDRLVCSPGHYVIAPFAAAAELGLLDDALVSGYGHNGSPIEAIGTERSPVVDYTCGSLGQGLSAAAGFALSEDNESGVNTYSNRKSDVELSFNATIEPAYLLQYVQSRTYRPIGRILIGDRKAEVDQNAVSKVLRDVTAVCHDSRGARSSIIANDFGIVFRIE